MRLQDKNILVIGGTGTIGSALVKRLLSFNPNTVRVFSRDEYKQFIMHEDLSEYGNIRFLLGDVRDRERLDKSMHGIDIVFDLAALKHVPACEYNPFEAVKTNVLGSQNVIECAIRNKVKRVVYTSSDKSVSPTNTMGATKLLAERLFSSADYSKGAKVPVFSSVRFGNVMETRGSVIPLWHKQISENRFITITEPAMTRFMMSINQAVELILKACQIARGGEVFVPKMPVIRLCDLASAVIAIECKKTGLDPESIEIRKSGLRSGEKMYEELMSIQESHSAIEYKRMFSILPHHKLYLLDQYGVNRAEVGEFSSAGQEVLTVEEIVRMLKDMEHPRSGIGSCKSRIECGQKEIQEKSLHTGVIIQARTNSSRLAEKVLKQLPYNSGTTVLQQVIRRVQAADCVKDIIVATTENKNDDMIVEIAEKENVKFYRGSENDVLDRYYHAAKENNLDLIVRITSDCPCLDPGIIERVVSGFRSANVDYVSNTLLRTYPRGLDVEAFSMEALGKAHMEASKPYEREHVTPYIYENPDSFKCCNVAAQDGENNPGIRVTLDTYEDYMLLCSIYDTFQALDFNTKDVVELFKEKPWLSLINGHIIQKPLE